MVSVSRGTATASPQGIGIPPAELGVWIFLATATMLFAAFLSAYVIRSASEDWVAVELPSLLWLNTGLLVASSFTMERARWRARRSGRAGGRRWLLTTAALGTLFVVGQVAAWRLLIARGVYLPTSPHSSFFYILTAVHAVHLLGGLCLLIWAAVGLRAERTRSGADPMRLCASYWHFMGAVWLLLFLVMTSL